MTKINKSDPSNEAERIPPPGKATASRMTLNAFDQTFIIGLLEKYDKSMRSSNKRQIEQGFKELSKTIYSELMETVIAQNQKINLFIEQQTDDSKFIRSEIGFIKTDVGHIKDRIILIESKQKTYEQRLIDLEEWAKMPLNFNKRITNLENYASVRWTLTRWMIAVVIAVMAAMIVHAYFPNIFVR